MGRSRLGLGGAVMTAIATLDDVSVSFRGRPVLRGVSGRFEAGSLSAIVGANGAGKSTLLKAMLGQVPLAKGRVNLGVARHQIAYLAQRSEIERAFPVSVLDCVTLGYWPVWRAWRGVPHHKIQAARAALEAVGLGKVAEQPVSTLSSGQFQRMLFVRVQMQNAQFILLDEPFNAVDARTTVDLLRMVTHWAAEGRTVVAVVHDHEQVRQWFPRSLLLADGELLAWGPTASTLAHENLFRAGQLTDARPAKAA